MALQALAIGLAGAVEDDGDGDDGQPVLQAITNQYFAQGVMNGLAIVAIAIIFDRASQAYGKRLQRHREISHG